MFLLVLAEPSLRLRELAADQVDGVPGDVTSLAARSASAISGRSPG
jgi:hypothetical protein